METSIYLHQSLASRITAKVWFLFEKIASSQSSAHSVNRDQLMTQIISEYDDMISRICFGYAGTKEEFEDIRQDAYINIWQGIHKFRGDASLKTWVYRVTLNTCVSMVRTRKKSGTTVELTEVVDLDDDSGVKLQRIAALYQSISMLSPIDKAIVMAWLDEMSYDEIAATVGLPKNVVATRLHRAKQKLKKLID